MNAVDTNVFLYAFDADEAVKQAKAQGLLGRLVARPRETVLLWRVAGELLSGLRRWQSGGKLSAADVENGFRDVLALFPLQLPSVDVFRISFDLRSRHSLSHWDSMLIAACTAAGVDTLYSEDLSAGTAYDGVTVIDPFA